MIHEFFERFYANMSYFLRSTRYEYTHQTSNQSPEFLKGLLEGYSTAIRILHDIETKMEQELLISEVTKNEN